MLKITFSPAFSTPVVFQCLYLSEIKFLEAKKSFVTLLLYEESIDAEKRIG